MGAMLLVYLSATAPVANALLRPLETRYASFGDLPQPSAHYVVVLGSGYAPRHGVAVTGALEGDGLTRITEGLRILRLAPGPRCTGRPSKYGVPQYWSKSRRRPPRRARYFGSRTRALMWPVGRVPCVCWRIGNPVGFVSPTSTFRLAGSTLRKPSAARAV